MNTTNTTANTTFESLTTLPVNLFRTAGNAIISVFSRFSYVQVPHIKLKAEHQALVLFHVVKQVLMYWEGWRDGKREATKNGETVEKSEKETNRTRREKKRKGRSRRVVGKGKYTVVFQ